MVTSYCYPSNLRCIYDVYKSHVIGCPGRDHLKACEHHQCPRMFKCLTTYCIPTYLMCDGVYHCPNGEDEQSCERFTCAGLLRCRYDNVCVHPSDICDGHRHCLMSGDDERFCNITMCPTMCTCHGSAIRCQNVLPARETLSHYFRYIMLRGVRIHSTYQLQSFNTLVQLHILSSTFHKEGLNKGLFLHLVVLQILVLCRNGIQVIQPFTFKGLIRLQHLDLTDNCIKELKSSNFLGMQLINDLDLSSQLIRQLEDFSFIGLNNLRLLNLSSNRIETLANRCFWDLANVELIDLTNNSFIHMSKSSFLGIQYHATVLFSNTIYCCYLNKNILCSVNTTLNQHPTNCQIVTESSATHITILVAAALTFIINLVLGFTQYSKGKSGHNMLSNYLSILNSFSSLYNLILSTIYIYHNGDYIYFGITFPFSSACLSLQILALFVVLLSPYTRLLLAWNRLLVTRYVFRKSPLSRRQVVICSIFGWCMSIAIILWGSIKYSERHFSCFPMLYEKSEPLIRRVDIWIYGTLSTVILIAVFTIYISILLYVKHQDKQFGRKGGKSLLTKTMITVMIEYQMYVIFGVIFVLYYRDVTPFHILITICSAMLYHGSSPLIYEIHKLCIHIMQLVQELKK